MLLTSSGRVRIGSLGVVDALGAALPSRDHIQHAQREDLAVSCGGWSGCTVHSESLNCTCATSTLPRLRTTPPPSVVQMNVHFVA